MSKQRLAALLWLAGLAVATGLALLTTTVRNDMTSFMPRAATPIQRMLLNELREGPVARLILIAVHGAPRERLAELSKEAATRLRSTGLFVRVANGEQLLDETEREKLLTYRYLLSPQVDADRFSVASLRNALERRLRELASPVPAFDKPWLAEDPTAELRAVLSAWRGTVQPNSYRGVWFDGEGERALLLAQTRAPGFDLDAQAKAQREIGATIRAIDDTVGLDLSGPGVFAERSRAIIRSDTTRLGITAAIVVMAILLASYRSPRLLLVGGLPLVSAVVAGTLAVDLVFGAVHGIVLAFGATVIGVAIDYPIHLFSHMNAGESVRRTLAGIWPTIRLGAITTAIAYLAMLGTDFPGLVQFATFAIAGLLTAAACTRWGLVGLLPEEPTSSHALRLAGWYARFGRSGLSWGALPVVLAVIALAFLLTRDGPPWEDDIAASSPIPAHTMARDRHLHAELGVPDTNHVLLVEAPDAEAALQASEYVAADLQRLVAEGVMASFDHPARYLPSARTQRARRASLPRATRLDADLDNALAGLPFKPNAFDPFVEAVAAARALPPLTPADVENTSIGVRVQSALLPVDDRWVALVTLAGVRKADALEDWLARREDPNLAFLDLKRDLRGLMAGFREQALARAVFGLAAIVLVLWIGLRSTTRTLRVLLPGLVAVIIVVAVLRATGQLLTLFHLVSLLLVVGISIDYGLFFSRDETDAGGRGRTFHGVVVCALSTVGVFAILASSELPVLRAIGTSVAVGVAVSFFASLLLAGSAPVRIPPEPT